MNNENILNLLFAAILSVIVIFCWQRFYDKPRLEKTALSQNMVKNNEAIDALNIFLDRNEALNNFQRVEIKSDFLSGSISLRGLRFDDLTLLKYKQTVKKNSPPVQLLSPSTSKNAYFMEFGWYNSNDDVDIPNSSTLWHSDKEELKANDSVNFRWVNKQNIEFLVSITLSNDYILSAKQSVINHSDRSILLRNYGLVNKINNNSTESDKKFGMVYQGAIWSANGTLHEVSYKDIQDYKNDNLPSELDWIGITDKYWLTSFIPDNLMHYSTNCRYESKSGFSYYQIDFLSDQVVIKSKDKFSLTHKMFVGPKKVDLLDKYEKEYKIRLFDRAIDFGWFYILTKPIFNLLNFFYKYVGNFGISIMLVTIVIKLLMFSFANKSYRSMKIMKSIQPEIEIIRNKYSNDKIKQQQEVMAIYKKENVNPISGCLPILIQIPVFFSIYKVLCITIEMRHAPFFGWVKDLSAPDPLTIFNLFGLLHINVPGFLMIGVWSIIMSLTMFIQQRLTPPPADPGQALAVKLMPLIFLFLFSGFPVGLLIYWSWNNILSILQQLYINYLEKT